MIRECEEKDLDEVQFNINKIVGHLFDLCIYCKVLPTKILKNFIKNLDTITIDKNKKNYNESLKKLDSINKRQILFELKLDNRCKNPYKGIVLTVSDKPHTL